MKPGLKVQQATEDRLSVQAGWQVGEQDGIKARPQGDGLSGKEDDGNMHVCTGMEPVGLSQLEAKD